MRHALHSHVLRATAATAGVAIVWTVSTGPGHDLARAVLTHPLAAHALALAVPAVVVMLARVADVTLGVVRTVLVVSGKRTTAGLVATLETAAWLAAASQVLSNLTPATAVGFCLGVGVGTVVGMALVRAAKWGVVTVRVFVAAGQGQFVAETIRTLGLGATVFTGQGKYGPRDMVLAMAPRREASQLTEQLAQFDDTFVMVDSDAVVGSVSNHLARV